LSAIVQSSLPLRFSIKAAFFFFPFSPFLFRSRAVKSKYSPSKEAEGWSLFSSGPSREPAAPLPRERPDALLEGGFSSLSYAGERSDA